MSEQAVGKVHWSFWVISIFALTWNGLGSLNYVMQMNADMVASLPGTHRAIIEGRPAWATAGFAIAVFGGSIGGLLLLLRKSMALYLFFASLLGVLVTIIHTMNVTGKIKFSTPEIIVMVITPVVVGAFFIWYARFVEGKGWIR
jgi:hypothetical protein